jgi:hypothetical protein
MMSYHDDVISAFDCLLSFNVIMLTVLIVFTSDSALYASKREKPLSTAQNKLYLIDQNQHFRIFIVSKLLDSHNFIKITLEFACLHTGEAAR